MSYDELKEKYNPEGSSLRKGQLRMVEMLKFIDVFCRNNNLTYWLDCGTLLGAVRHGGFIPWDDDTDICMPLEDMLKFKKLMIHQNPSKEFVLQCHETDSNYNRSQWIVLRDLKSEYMQDSNFHNGLRYKGLQIDIFPLEKDVPISLKKFADTIQLRFINRATQSEKKLYRMIRPFRNCMWLFLNHFIIPVCRLFKKKNNYYNMAYGIPFYHKRFIKDIYPLKKAKFEDSYFNVPNNVDSYLTNLYGDWRKIPSQIKTHKVEIVFY